MRVAGNQNSEMGLSFNSSAKSMKDVTVLTVILGILGVLLYLTGIGGRFSPNETVSFYLFYIFISSPAQEFLYRGALVRILTRLNVSERSKMIVSSALYSFVHIIYKDFWTLVLTFCIGIIWYRSYRKTNNLLGVCVSHAVLGIVTILAGVID
ncbi:TPA: CPBP family intramembrane metalloprotease [Streptococcus suis]|uniref:CPBP family intramembrane glutamic endopeptidase n=1 Tax=Streptococcus TaxID=1301 RepID=UPI0014322FF3|nr:CPBP family intramembrane glutamic endopeptidase [Streptococcus suis]NJW40150.1 CPBP family intramembrane metalloprotease [Streptococcus suis]NQH15158.1 CPBP family intramembrane metalloprotease [Streptococcus suis]HEM6153637.1 CPBP family intramembrane metalloprotease [Streptococcus suis]HEM6277768.1 CPBP family intramembrane metalloprotease [Streptococcus suis]HEM6279794.1 CPBP family intramembrane metalloprotease [Streptococcus suis]